MAVVGILGGNARVAIIRAGRETFVVRVGEPIGDAVVVAILPTKVVLKSDKTTFELPAPSTARAPLVLAAPPGGATPLAAGTDMRVTGILGGATRVAIIRAGGETFITKVGERVGRAVVVGIFPTKVVLKKDKTTFELPAPSAARAPLVLGAMPEGTPTAPPAGTGMIVTGILEGTTRVAIIRAGGKSFIAGVGEPVDDAVVVAILPNKVIVKKNGATSELRIGGKPSI
jgi:hypothetical protein